MMPLVVFVSVKWFKIADVDDL